MAPEILELEVVTPTPTPTSTPLDVLENEALWLLSNVESLVDE